MGKKPKQTIRQTKFTPAQRQEISRLLYSAAEGKCPWLSKAVLQAGYLPPLGKWRQGDIAKLYGITAQSVGRWSECPRNPDQTYSAAHVIKWREGEIESDDNAALSARGGPEMEEQQLRLITARAIKVELENAEKARQLVNLDDIIPRLNEFSAMLRNCGEALARQHGEEARLLLDEAITDAQRSLLGDSHA